MMVLVVTKVVLVVVAIVPVEAIILFHLMTVVCLATTILPGLEEPVMPTSRGDSRSGRSE